MSPSGAYYASQLRHELCVRNRAFAEKHKLPHVESYGSMPVVVYGPENDTARHGNFIAASYAAILRNPDWRRRLNKVHAQARQSLPHCDRGWRELDSCISSDALLMNIFCYPGILDRLPVRALLGIEGGERARFGLRARVPLQSGLADRTEVDMRISTLFVEAKLTERDFQGATSALVETYCDFSEVFETKLLPRVSVQPEDDSRARGAKKYACYQLIRNVLAAHANECSFAVLLDARRPDLLEAWYSVMRCVRPGDLRCRCKVLTWQELSAELPSALRTFLDAKYGIVPPGQAPTPCLDKPEGE